MPEISLSGPPPGIPSARPEKLSCMALHMSLEYSDIDEERRVAAEGDNQSALAASLRFELRPGISLGPGGDSVTPAA